jgi:hypothetical protein
MAPSPGQRLGPYEVVAPQILRHDGASYVYSYRRTLADLCLLDGLR